MNTSGYHPQTDGLVEKMNSTVIAMLSKVVETSGRDWDIHFCLCIVLQCTTRLRRVPFICCVVETPAYQMQVSDTMVDSDDYKENLTSSLSTA